MWKFYRPPLSRGKYQPPPTRQVPGATSAIPRRTEPGARTGRVNHAAHSWLRAQAASDHCRARAWPCAAAKPTPEALTGLPVHSTNSRTSRAKYSCAARAALVPSFAQKSPCMVTNYNYIKSTIMKYSLCYGHNMKHETVSVAQLKSGLSAYLAKARAGTTLTITSHRKVIAHLAGVATAPPQGVPDELAQLVADGKLTPGNGILLTLDLPPPLRLSTDSPSVSEMVLQDRGAR